MFKKFLALPVMLIAILVFTQSAPAEPEIKRTGKECDKTQKKDCDKKSKKDCDKKGGERHSRGDYKRGKGGFNILMIADKIGLSADQVESIKGIKSSHGKAQIMTNAEIDVLKIELKELSHDYSTNIKVYARKVREIEAKKSDEKIASFKLRKDISALMTPEQRTKIKEYYMKKYKK
ncbi:MAG: hypothetical protein IMF07_00070 [Proteobacteria bacterium]|nr:hypothetical protein [Pseudomonadota bacterium]